MITADLPIARIYALASDREFLSAIEGLYAELEVRILARIPVCIQRGDCCRFQSYDHRLYVTPAELAYFLAKTEAAPIAPKPSADACPYQDGKLCTAREARPVGCRIFFCEAASQTWQGPETEQMLGRIKFLHDRYELPYAYMEWLEALRQLAHSDVANSPFDVRRGAI